MAGWAEADNVNILFSYGKSYLNRIGDSNTAISNYEPELLLKAGVLPLLNEFFSPVPGFLVPFVG